MRMLRAFVTIVLLAAGSTAAVAAAQAVVTSADITRLETTADEIARQVDALKSTDPTLAADVARTLGDLRDEVVYLRVKMRREGGVTRDEYATLRDQLETLRIRANGQKVAAQPVVDDDEAVIGTAIPVGTEVDVRLQTPLNSGTAKVEQRFEATTVLDYAPSGRVVLPAGSIVRGFVSSVRAAGKVDRRGSMTLSFDELRVGTRTYRLRASVTQAIDRRVGEDTARIGAGAAVGAIIGGLLGGGKGVLLGVLVGGGGTMAATDGTDVDLPAGTILRLRLDQPVEVLTP